MAGGLALAGIGLGLQALGGIFGMSSRSKQAQAQRALANASATEYLRQAGIRERSLSEVMDFEGVGGVGRAVGKMGSGQYSLTGEGVIGQMQRQGRTFMGRARVGAALSGAGAGGSIESSLQESSKNIQKEIKQFYVTALKQAELIRQGGEAQAAAIAPTFGDALSLAGGLFSGAYQIGQISGLPRGGTFQGPSMVGMTQQAIPGSSMWGL